jgi:guanine nucleotide-binding protein G(i) subunit alpha
VRAACPPARVHVPLLIHTYTGGDDYNAAADYITQRFVELNRSPDKKTVYPHLTCATDTENIRFVWAAVNDIVTRTALRRAGLM